MIYAQLLWGFLRVGCFAFGGAYGAIPLIRDVVLSYGWLTDDQLAYFIAVSESTPGPIMVNLATYIGSDQAGLWGAALATLAVVLPSFLIILLAATLLKRAMLHPYAQAALKGVKPCVAGVVLATGLCMAARVCLPGGQMDLRAALLTAGLLGLTFTYRAMRKKAFSPIWLIVLSAAAGCLLGPM